MGVGSESMEVSGEVSWAIAEDLEGTVPPDFPAWPNFDAEELFGGHHRVDPQSEVWELEPEQEPHESTSLPPQPIAKRNPKRAKPMPLRNISKLNRSHSSTSHPMMASSPFEMMDTPGGLQLAAPRPPHHDRWSMTQSEDYTSDYSWLPASPGLQSLGPPSVGTFFCTEIVPEIAPEGQSGAKQNIGQKPLQDGPVVTPTAGGVKSLDEVIKAASIGML